MAITGGFRNALAHVGRAFADDRRSEMIEIAGNFMDWHFRMEHGTEPVEAAGSFVHTYAGEGLTACGLEVVGPCPECATANGERA